MLSLYAFSHQTPALAPGISKHLTRHITKIIITLEVLLFNLITLAETLEEIFFKTRNESSYKDQNKNSRKN